MNHTPRPDCKGCKIEINLDKFKIFEPQENGEGQTIVNYAVTPEVPAHIVVQPRHCVDIISELTIEEAKDLMEKIWLYSKAIQKVLTEGFEARVERIYIYNPSETEGYHLHFHVKPRFDFIPKENRGSKYLDYALPQLLEKGFTKKICNSIRREAKRLKKKMSN